MIVCMVRHWIVVGQVVGIGSRLVQCGYMRVLAEWFEDSASNILGQHVLNYSHAHLFCWLCIRCI